MKRTLLLACVLALIPASASAEIVVGAGDIATGTNGDTKTSDLILALQGVNRVLTFGDNVYPDGTASQFSSLFHPTWGRFKSLIEPSPGNHDWHIPGASGYEGYFGVQAGQLRSFKVGEWLLVSLDSTVNIAQQADDLATLLESDNSTCEIVYFHHARFTSGEHGPSTSVSPFWNVMYANGVELNLVGHEHDYERFAKQNPQGQHARDGVRQVVVGTGGTNTRAFAGVKPNSQVRLTGNQNWGVLRLNLRALDFGAKFIRATGGTGTVADRFGGTCHG